MNRWLQNLECRLMVFFLKRYCRKYLDQFDFLKVRTKHGWVYVTISNKKLLDSPGEVYYDLR